MNIFLVIILWMIGAKLGMGGGYYAVLTVSAIVGIVLFMIELCKEL